MVWLGVLWGTFAIALLLFANRVAPPVARTGGFGEGDCTVCHTGTVNSGPGSVTITVPEFYTSGDTFPISVTVSDSVARSWGFELSARTEGSQQAGDLIAGTDGRSQLLSSSNGIQYIGHTVLGVRPGTTGGVSFDFMWQAPDVSAGPVIFHAAGDGANNNFSPSGDNIYTTSATSQPQISSTYYFAHIAVGAGWQTTITYINFSPQEVTCQTDFLSDDGSPLLVSFEGLGAVASRTDILPPGGSVHEETNVALSAPLAPGWAQASCSGQIKASLLFRRFEGGVPVAEAGVNAVTVPATQFVTFAEQGVGAFGTGVAYANSSSTSALVTFTAKDTAGQTLASVNRTLLPGGHDAQNMAPLFGLTSCTGSIEVTSTVPIVSLSLNFEADPVFSSLPPGQVGKLTLPPPPDEPPPDEPPPDDDYC